MFKFMKSKKGFTLVELMIVVVIMAILVAVAVPIFSAVTKNAKKKTCIGNQRQIISSVGDWIMLHENSSTLAGGFSVSGGQENGELNGWVGIGTDDQASIEKLFKTAPVCPDENNVIKVTITAGADGSQSTVSTVCVAKAADGDTGHGTIPNT